MISSTNFYSVEKQSTWDPISGVYNGLMGLIDQSACWWDALTLSAPHWDLNAVFYPLACQDIK